ncbi:hypothetical protein ABGB17_26865 [Sphaerisporangium sp. B11E5]|uniref:hypothetical protein n=1 Tax=Sphaerisporangium sp. B11E5 TaxID=3153563 RepID=UPI00325DEEFE
MSHSPTHPAEPVDGAARAHADESAQRLVPLRAATSKDVSTSDPALLPTPHPQSGQQSFAELYEDRLRDIWRAVHGTGPDAVVGVDAEGWLLVREAVFDAGFLSALTEAVLRRSMESAAGEEPFEGNPDAVELQVASATENMPEAMLERFVRGPLAATVERLERQNATREQVADIVLRPLRKVAGRPEATMLGMRLLGYVQGQRERTLGYCLTVAIIADLLGESADTESSYASLIGYHSALRGVWELLTEGELEFEGRARRFTATNTANLATEMWKLIEASPSTPEERERRHRVMRTLKMMAAVAKEAPDIEDAAATAVLEGLGVRAAPPRAALAVIRTIGIGVADLWSDDLPDQARLLSAGAVAAATMDESDRMAAAFFNAGVTLLQSDRRETSTVIWARMVLNLLGMRWGLAEDGTPAAFIAGDGLDCAVNLLGSAVEHRRLNRPDPPAPPELHRVARLVLGLLDLMPDHPDNRLKASRISRSGRILEAEPLPLSDLGPLTAAVDEAISALRTAVAGTRPEEADPLLDTARTVRWVFEDLLGRPSWPLADRVAELVAMREHAGDVFARGYAEYARPLDDPYGTGPLVPAGMLTEQEWAERCARLLGTVPDSMVRALRGFSL